MREAGLHRKFTSHSIRHGLVTRLLLNGANMLKVAKRVGHSSTAIQEIYTHITSRDTHDVLELV